MNAHTPGIWLYKSEGRDAYRLVEIDGASIAHIAALTNSSGASHLDANIRLIAAAPELLDALQNLENDDGSIPAHAWALVQSAIAKATGATA